MNERLISDLNDLAWIGYPPPQPGARPGSKPGIKAIILFLHGRNQTMDKTRVYPWERELISKGALFVHPYYGPWQWGTESISAYLDDLIDAVLAQCCDQQADKPTMILAGGSMGGHACLQHARYSTVKWSRCIAMCPVTDLKKCYDFLPEVRRSMVLTLRDESGTNEEIFERLSPVFHADELASMPYLIQHNADDALVPPQEHGEPMAQALEAAGHDVTYITPEGIHGANIDATPEAATRMEFFLRGWADS